MKIHENPWKSRTSTKINENRWKSLEIHANPSKCMKIHQNVRKLMKSMENPSKFVKIMKMSEFPKIFEKFSKIFEKYFHSFRMKIDVQSSETSTNIKISSFRWLAKLPPVFVARNGPQGGRVAPLHTRGWHPCLGPLPCRPLPWLHAGRIGGRRLDCLLDFYKNRKLKMVLLEGCL